MTVAYKFPAAEQQMVQANGLEFCVEMRGDPSGEPVIFIMGLAAQLTLWPDALLDRYVTAGYRVICFDNRDVGLSSHLSHRLTGHPMTMMARYQLGLSVSAPYTLHDMATDVVGIMDALALEQAHIVGVSMGGMIAQALAGAHPGRVQSLTLIMTSTNSPRLALPKLSLIWNLSGIGAQRHDEASVLKRSLAFWQAIQSPGHPTAPQEVQARILRDYRRSYHPAGIVRQTRAILGTSSLSSLTRTISMPTVIIHGKADPLVRPGAADQLKYLIPHASVELIEGMGHDMPEGVLATIARAGMAGMQGF